MTLTNKVKVILKHIGNTCLTFVFICSLVFLGLKAMKIESFVVMSGSMEPTIHTGAIVFVDTKYDYEQLKIDDIVVFNANQTHVIHRIVEQTSQGFITKGDANDQEDGITVTQQTFQGKELFSLPYVGYVIALLNQYHFIYIMIGLVICYFLYVMIKTKTKQERGIHDGL